MNLASTLAQSALKWPPALDTQTLDAFCLNCPRPAPFKRPRHYFFIDAIPSNPTGEVERGKIKDLLLSLFDRPLD